MRLFLLLGGLGLAAVAASAISAPAPKDDRPRPTVAQVRAALGKPVNGPEVRALAETFPKRPTLRFTSWGDPPGDDDREPCRTAYLVWADGGLDLLLVDLRVNAAFLYNRGVDGHGRYAGELPDGLSFDDDIPAVRKKLGEPDDEPNILEYPAEDGRPARDEMSYRYARRGVTVWFRRPKGGKEAVEDITIFQPKKP